MLKSHFFFSSEDEEFVSSFITSRSEKQLVQQLKRSLLSTKNYSDIAVNSVKKVKLLKCKDETVMLCTARPYYLLSL